MAVQVVSSAAAWRQVPYPRVLRFTGKHCGPCRISRPAYAAAAADPALSAWASFWECDAEEQPEVTTQYGVRTIPALFIETAPGRVTQVVGALPLNRLLARLREVKDRA